MYTWTIHTVPALMELTAWGRGNRQMYSVSDGYKYSAMMKRHMLLERGIRSSRGGIISILNRQVEEALVRR